MDTDIKVQRRDLTCSAGNAMCIVELFLEAENLGLTVMFLTLKKFVLWLPK